MNPIFPQETLDKQDFQNMWNQINFSSQKAITGLWEIIAKTPQIRVHVSEIVMEPPSVPIS